LQIKKSNNSNYYNNSFFGTLAKAVIGEHNLGIQQAEMKIWREINNIDKIIENLKAGKPLPNKYKVNQSDIFNSNNVVAKEKKGGILYKK
jgi:hypothetical protein